MQARVRAVVLALVVAGGMPQSTWADRPVFCTQCGTKYLSGEAFCSRDGTRLSGGQDSGLESSALPSGEGRPKSSGGRGYVDIVQGLERSVVTVKAGESLGSGFCYRDSATVVTNYHVVEGSPVVEIVERSGKRLKVVRRILEDPERDLAVLAVQESDLQPIRRAKTIEVGQVALAIGSPLGLEFSASDGVISAIRGKSATFNRAVQTSCPISRGNSGGPLLNEAGEVVGVNTFSLVAGQNLNFAVPIDYVDECLERGGVTSAPGSATRDRSVASLGAERSRQASYSDLVDIVLRHAFSLFTPATMPDALMLLRALDDAGGSNPRVKAVLSSAYSYVGRKPWAEKYLKEAEQLVRPGEGDLVTRRIVAKARIILEVAFGENDRVEVLLGEYPGLEDTAKILRDAEVARRRGIQSKALLLAGKAERTVREMPDAAWYNGLRGISAKGGLAVPVHAEKVLRLKGKPHRSYDLPLGDDKVQILIYRRTEGLYQWPKYLALCLFSGVYWTQFQTSLDEPNPATLQVHFREEFRQIYQRARDSWTKFESDPRLLELLATFPEFDGMGWSFRLNIR